MKTSSIDEVITKLTSIPESFREATADEEALAGHPSFALREGSHCHIRLLR
jgi:hypothetical protein